MQLDAAGTSGDVTEVDCSQRHPRTLIRRLPIIPTHLPFPFDYHHGATDEGLLERVNAGDGYAQQVYGERLQSRLFSKYGDLGQGADRQRWIHEFDAMTEMLILAIQNRSPIAARRLGDALLIPGPKHDPIIAAAWLLIEQQMGGDFIVKVQQSGRLVLTDEQMEISELLAASYIEEYDLSFLDPAALEAEMAAEAGNVRFQDCVENDGRW